MHVMCKFNEAINCLISQDLTEAGLAQAFTLAALAAAGIVEYYDHRMQTSEVNMPEL